MESGGASGGGGGDGGCSGGGHLCHVCGYKYASAHPSAKQRRAHRKNCGGKPPSAAKEGEGDGKKLLLGEGDGEGGGGNGAGASDCGGGFAGSAQEVRNAVDDEHNAEHSSLNDAGVQVIINRSTEDCLISRSNIPSEVAPKANETEIPTEVVTQLSENAPYLEDSHPSPPTITCEQHQDPCPSEPEDGARFSSGFPADEMSKLGVVSLASDAASSEISAHTKAIVGCPDDVAVTEEDLQINTIGKDKTSFDMLAKGSETDSSHQEKLCTKIVEGHSATTVEEDPSVDKFTAVSEEEILGEETESKEQNRLILTSSIEQVSTFKEPVNLPGNKESCSEKNVCTDDTNGDDLFELGTGGCHLDPADVVKPQRQTDSTSVAADRLTVPKLTEIGKGQHCPDADGNIQDVSSAIGPAVGAEVISACSTATLPKNICSPEVTTGDSIQDIASHTSGTTSMPSQVDLAERSCPTSHEINMVSSKDGVEENKQNESVSADITSHEINQVHSIDVEENQGNEDITANTTSHGAFAVRSTGDYGENKQNEEIIAEASHKVSILQGTSNVEEKEQIEEVIANPASEKINVMSSKDIVEEKKQSEVFVETTHELNVACSIENVEEKKQSEEIAADLTCEINAVNTPSNTELKKHNEKTTRDPTTCEINMTNATDNVEEQKQIEEITTEPSAINVIHSPEDEDKKQSEDMTEGPISHDITVVHGTDNVKEKNEDNTSDPTSDKIDAVGTAGSVQEKQQNEEITADPTSRRINVVHTVDDVEENKTEERTSDPTSGKIDAESNTDGVEEKRRNEEIAADSSSHENNIPQVMDNAEKQQSEEVAADPAPDKIPAAQNTDDVLEKKQKEETATTSEINKTQGANDDQNEEITDKEMTINSDKSHVSLKALLSEKGMEAREKKTSTKDRVLSFRRRSSKDSESPAKPGSGQQDWNSPARLPVEKAPKGKKQQWIPFICCPSIN